MLLGELLVQKGILTPRQLKEALEEQKVTKEFLGALLIRKGFVQENKLIQVLSEQFNIPFVELSREYIDWDVALSFPSTLVVDHEFLPLRREARGVIVAVTNPLDAAATSEIEKIAGFEKVFRVLVTSAEMEKAVRAYKQKLSDRIKKLFDR
jgi:type IV pilus assembly protein PilB